jgi:hypothetical protein
LRDIEIWNYVFHFLTVHFHIINVLFTPTHALVLSCVKNT